MKTLWRTIKIFLTMLVLMPLLALSAVSPGNALEGIRIHTRIIEFDFIDWTLDALALKSTQGAVSAPRYMGVEQQRKVVFEYLRLVRWVNLTAAEIERVYADPNVTEPERAAADLNEQLRIIRGMEESLKPLAESVLQYQVSTVLADMNLTVAGQPIPPVLYHVTRLPNAMIVSPRMAIRQEANISLMADLPPEEIVRLEAQVEQDQELSALVVPVGGVGTYPTMVMSTTDLPWLVEIIAHEWIHNYLTLRPVGALYMASGEMRTINETTANLAGKEIGQAVLERYYPELAPPPPPPAEPAADFQEETAAIPIPEPEPEDLAVFSFRREMHVTRLQVDELLEAGEVEQAETYMEERRRVFWEQGYRIRRLNQAYFAFYGAYNDVPGGGAGGSDPIGPAVVALRRQSSSLADFLNRIAWVTSFQALEREVARGG
jgi:hypothetical protein